MTPGSSEAVGAVEFWARRLENADNPSATMASPRMDRIREEERYGMVWFLRRKNYRRNLTVGLNLSGIGESSWILSAEPCPHGAVKRHEHKTDKRHHEADAHGMLVCDVAHEGRSNCAPNNGHHNQRGTKLGMLAQPADAEGKDGREPHGHEEK